MKVLIDFWVYQVPKMLWMLLRFSWTSFWRFITFFIPTWLTLKSLATCPEISPMSTSMKGLAMNVTQGAQVSQSRWICLQTPAQTWTGSHNTYVYPNRQLPLHGFPTSFQLKGNAFTVLVISHMILSLPCTVGSRVSVAQLLSGMQDQAATQHQTTE